MDKDGKKEEKTVTYTYDLLGRIQKEMKTGSEDISYAFDSNNNRIFVVIICIVAIFILLKINCKQTEIPQNSLAEKENKNQIELLEPGYKILCQYKTEFADENYRYIGTIFENDDERILYMIKEYKNGTYR